MAPCYMSNMVIFGDWGPQWYRLRDIPSAVFGISNIGVEIHTLSGLAYGSYTAKSRPSDFP